MTSQCFGCGSAAWKWKDVLCFMPPTVEKTLATPWPIHWAMWVSKNGGQRQCLTTGGVVVGGKGHGVVLLIS